MSTICIETIYSSPHDFVPGSDRDRRRLEAELWKVCGQKRGHHLHRDTCENGCGRVSRPGKDAVAFCCKACRAGGGHTERCDTRAEES